MNLGWVHKCVRLKLQSARIVGHSRVLRFHDSILAWFRVATWWEGIGDCLESTKSVCLSEPGMHVRQLLGGSGFGFLSFGVRGGEPVHGRAVVR